MRRETLATLIDSTANIGTALLKDTIEARQERKQKKMELEHEKEIAKARAQAMGGQNAPLSAGTQSDTSEDDPLYRAEELADEMATLLEEARKVEDCGMCEMLIKAIQKQPVSVQKRAIPELRVMKQKAESGASTEELKDYIKSTDVLKEIMKAEATNNTESTPQPETGGDQYEPAGTADDPRQKTIAEL